jgi:prolyl oligopeptidase
MTSPHRDFNLFMFRRLLIVIPSLTLMLACTTVAPDHAAQSTGELPPASPSSVDIDPYLWLEEIDSERALAWVRDQNERTRRELGAEPEFELFYEQALAALNSTSRVPSLSWTGDHLYSLWRSSEHPRGLYRRTTIDSLRIGEPEWQTVLDIDALSRQEGRQWVFRSMTCLPPENRPCLLSLSPGGGDAVEIREFDTGSLSFVENGFFVPLAKSAAGWIDENTIFVASDFGPGSLTESGYARAVRQWSRGTPLSHAPTLYQADPASISVSARRIRTKEGDIDLVTETRTTWTRTVHQLIDGTLHLFRDLPENAVVEGGFRQRLVIKPTDAWHVDGRMIPAGSVVIADPSRLRGGSGRIDVLIEPSDSLTIESVNVLDDVIFVRTLQNVTGQLHRFTPTAADWSRELIAFPEHGAISVRTTRGNTGEALALFQSFLDPPTLYYVSPVSRQPERLLAQEATFDSSRFQVSQNWTVSKDGTRIPYFVVAAKDLKLDGRNPLHMFSYGGFRTSLTPAYSGSYEQLYGAYGKLWLERGGVFVLANIRGGGEFGPEWHSTVLKENRHKVFEDFEAIAEDVVKRRITSPELIGIEGRSNGGLLTLGTMIRRPELYGAVISGVPLSDMRRYHRLLAGASWVAEYGNPDLPEEWAYIGEYSPYQNFRAGASYPPVFIYTSTRDDRVHPGHARKTVARLQADGHQVWYYENTEGGHGGSSTNAQLAYRVALSYTHLWKHLRPSKTQTR